MQMKASIQSFLNVWGALKGSHSISNHFFSSYQKQLNHV